MLLIIISCLIFLIFFILISLAFEIRKKSYNDWEKISPFECGFNLINSPRNPFSLSFFLIRIIFLIFDIEIIIIIPFLLNIFYINIFIWIILIIFFIIILLWGLIHEWFLGSLNWL